MQISFHKILINKFKTLIVLNLLIFSACHKSIISQNQNTIGHYISEFTNSTITIDGNAHEGIWSSVPFSNSFVDIVTGQKENIKTRFKIIHDTQFVYIFIALEDTHIKASMATNDTTLYNENCFEVFIDPDHDGLNYIELEINPLQTKFDLLLDKPYKKGGHASIDYNIKDLNYAVAIEGTLNKADDIDHQWSIEIALPIEQIQKLSTLNSKVDLSSWRMHFARIMWPSNILDNKYVKLKTDKPKIQTWTKQSAFDNHLPNEWGEVTFKRN